MIKRGILKKSEKISAKRVVLTSLFVDVFDIVLNFIVAIITGSMVMAAETIQGFADFITDVFVLVGLKSSRKKPTKKYPVGHGRALYVWTLMATFVMFLLTSTITFYFGLKRFLNPEPIENIFLAYGALIFFVLTNGYAFSISSKRLLQGKKYRKIINVFRKSSLVETKIIVVSDFLGTTAALIGIIALVLYRVTGNLKFDGLGAMGIGIAIMLFALLIMKEVKNLLIGKSASPGIENRIKNCVLKTKEVRKLLNLKTVNIGLGKILVNIEINLKNNLVTDKIERIIEKIETGIKKEIPEVKQINIEIRAKKTISRKK